MVPLSNSDDLRRVLAAPTVDAIRPSLSKHTISLTSPERHSSLPSSDHCAERRSFIPTKR